MIDNLKSIQNENRMVEALRFLRPVSIDASLTRIGSKGDGGYVMVDSFDQPSNIYSFGVGGNSWWDMVMETKGYHVYMYDHTVDYIEKDGLPYEVPEGQNLFFNKIGIGNKTTNKLKTVQQIIEDNEHQNKNDMILQCDIEGSEWEVFANISQNTLSHFSQILLEFHTLHKGIDDDLFYENMYNSFKNLTEQFIPFHVHGNNCSVPPFFTVKGKIVPTTLEVSFVNKNIVSITKEIPTFPTELDFPNRRNNPEIELGTFRW